MDFIWETDAALLANYESKYKGPGPVYVTLLGLKRTICKKKKVLLKWWGGPPSGSTVWCRGGGADMSVTTAVMLAW